MGRAKSGAGEQEAILFDHSTSKTIRAVLVAQWLLVIALVLKAGVWQGGLAEEGAVEASGRDYPLFCLSLESS